MSKQKSGKLKDLELGRYPIFLMFFGLRRLRMTWYERCAEELAKEEALLRYVLNLPEEEEAQPASEAGANQEL